jgi:carbonic anhydrase/acetyltransferase-like protein (isoleucine patch superfamily)
MPVIKTILGHTPKIGKDSFIAENATIVGQLTCGEGCSFWFGSVVRADVNTIVMGNKVNVQDNATVHCTYEKYPTVIGNNVSIGHNAIVHGCRIEDNVLIGMGAIVMDNCVVEEGCIVAAGSVVTQGKRLSKGTLWAGVPAKEIGAVPDRLRSGEIERIANNYVKYSSWYSDDQ